MSTFNVVVPPHPLAPVLLMAINWAQPNDPEKKYPLLGRMRYVWVDKDKNIKLLLKDGPNSWSEEKDEIMKQIETHETFVGVEVLERDPVYLIATFKPIMETSYERPLPIEELFEKLDMLDELAQAKGSAPLTTHPFELFDKAMEDMGTGKTNPRMEKLAEGVKNMLEQSLIEDELGEIAKESKVDGLEPQRIKVMTVNPDGSIEDKTDVFVKDQK